MTGTYNVFIVDDEQMVLRMLRYQLKDRFDLKTNFFSSGEACIENLPEKPDIVILDYNMDVCEKGKMNGLDTLLQIKKYAPKTRIAMLSSQDCIETAVTTMKKGASDYIVKDSIFPCSTENTINNIIQEIELEEEIKKLTIKVKRDKHLLIFTLSSICMLLFSLLVYNWIV